jgi:enoyl-CoA hydratase/carnithine racemase
MTEPHLLSEVTDGVLRLTLNRPEKLNALTGEMISDLLGAVADGAARTDVRVIVITGAGRGFCAGMDLAIISGRVGGQTNVAVPEGAAPPQFGDDVGPPVGLAAHLRFGSFLSTRKPIIAAVNGVAVGFGLAIALHCDIRLAARSASFNTTFARLGVPAEQGVGWLLPRLVGPAVAADLLFAPRKVGADEAQRIGLVNHLLNDEGFDDEVMEYARNIAANSAPRALAVMKAQIWGYQDLSYDEALEDTDREIKINTATADFREAISSYVNKQAPRFTAH